MNSKIKHIRSIVKEIQRHIRSLHNTYPEEFIKRLDYDGLLANCHPLYRGGYQKRLTDAGITLNY
jgi:hypothetical protein